MTALPLTACARSWLATLDRHMVVPSIIVVNVCMHNRLLEAEILQPLQCVGWSILSFADPFFFQ
jgi:hypothetical protein